MEKQHMLVSAITDTIKNWSAKVRVLTKLLIKTTISSPTKYQKMILADEMGNTVEAIMYKTDIDLYKNNLEVSKTYQVSNAQVSRVKDMHRNDLVSSLYQWTITSGTSVMPVVEDTISCALFHPDFIRFHEFATFLGSKKAICTVCVIIEKNIPKKVMANNKQQILHEYTAIDQDMTPFVVTLWSDIVSEEIYAIINATHTRLVLALLNFVVKGYYGLSLSSGSSSVVLTEMDNQIFARMRKWRVDQQSFIDEMIERGGFFEEKVGIRTGMAIPINTILEVLQEDKVNLFNIKVRYLLTKTPRVLSTCAVGDVDGQPMFHIIHCLDASLVQLTWSRSLGFASVLLPPTILAPGNYSIWQRRRVTFGHVCAYFLWPDSQRRNTSY